MQSIQSTTKLLRRLWVHISPRRRKKFGLLLILMVLASFSEIVSLGAVLPFLAFLTAPERLFVHPATQIFIKTLGINSADQLLLPLTIVFSLAAIMAGTMRLLLLWASTRLSFATGADISNEIYRRAIFQPYSVHIARNSSAVLDGTRKADTVVFGVIYPFLALISSSIMLISIMMVLLSIEPVISLVAFGSFAVIYALIIHFTRSKLLIGSQRIARGTTLVMKSLQEGLGGIRDILIDGSQAIFCQIYRNADIPVRRAQGDNVFIGQSPRYVMEALGLLLIAVFAYVLAKQSDGIANTIPILGTLALGAQRLLPVLQQAYASWTSIQGGSVSLQDTLVLLEQPLPDYADQPPSKPIPFHKLISFNQLSFQYGPQGPWVLKNIDLSIQKGSRVGFIGKTGSGKSTLLDIAMGLLLPNEGTITIDGRHITPGNCRAWQAHIAHVPQSIFLADSTIEENIAFGVPRAKIDHDRVCKAAHQAQIADIIETWPEKYETFVGERGVRLSGGQRQRIGIARALYKEADVIVFDEATSALDNETEQVVMQTIENLSKDITILIIAHRLTTLKNCTQIVELSAGEIVRSGTYQEVVTLTT